MYFRGEQHEENFEWELRTRPEMSNSDISVLYLLTADDKLWEQIQDAVTPRHCFFEDMRPKHLSLSGYTFFRLARDIYENRCTMAMTELVHPQILPPQGFSRSKHCPVHVWVWACCGRQTEDKGVIP